MIQVLLFEKLIPMKFSNELIKTLNKACQNTDIPTKAIKSNADLFASYVFRNFNYCLEKDEFSCVLKHADVVPVHKKKEKKQ